jgi:hypothetical protein
MNRWVQLLLLLAAALGSVPRPDVSRYRRAVAASTNAAFKLCSSIVVSAGSASIIGNSRVLAAEVPAILRDRAAGDDGGQFRPGITATDVFYPDWFSGKWNVSSTFDTISAPLGVEVFGGQPVFDAAQQDLGSAIYYISKFRAGVSPSAATVIISDRLYNVEQIAIASMGQSAIVDDFQPVRC